MTELRTASATGQQNDDKVDFMRLASESTGRTVEQINEARMQVRAGDLTPIKELLYDSALLLHGAAVTSVTMANLCPGFPAKHIDVALKAVDACQKIFFTLAEHSDTNRLSTIAGNLFQENLERIMNYIARKGGKIYRYELLTSRVIGGNAIEYDKHLAALIDAGFLSANQTGRRKEITYFMATPDEQPLIEVINESDEA